MKKFTPILLLFVLFTSNLSAQNTRELIINSTGYGFSTHPSSPNGVAQWDYIQKFANITHNGQNASVTAVRLYVDWTEYEPTEGNYQRAKFRQAVEAILSLNNNTMKIAFHFPYQLSKNFIENPNTFASPSDMAYTHQGVIAGDHYYRAPSLYNTRLRNKYYDFVSDALNQISDYYGRVLYVQSGNGNAEEFGQPYAKDVNQSNMYTVALHDSWAVNAWRTEYLPCRYPGQSTVTWGSQTYNISNAPVGGNYGSHYSNWNDDHGREYHRFGSWGIQRFYRGLRDVVKNKSSNIKVLYFGSDFGGMQGNLIHFHSAQMPMSMVELDGLSSSAGGDVHTNRDKILAVDVLKSTNPNKIAAIEFDPTDLGQEFAPQNILPGVAEEWFARAYKHGADYIHLAMHFHDPAIQTLKPALAMVRANYIDVPYTPPARQTPVNVNVFPNVFTGTNLFWDTWKNTLNGENWTVTDNAPASLKMIDDGYWENIWSCTPVDPCTFTLGASGPSGNVNINSSVTLNASCTGSNCTGVTYSWSGNGISGSGSSVSFNAPNTPGSYTYTVTASKSSCSNKTATVTVNVVNPVDPCAFTISASGPSGSVSTSSSVTLNSSCSGSCSGVTYAWSGNGISGSGSSVSFTAPNTQGSYTYTVTASKSSCSNKTATYTLTVDNGGSNPCNFTEKGVVGTWNSLQVQTRQFTINGQLKWAVVVLETTPNVDRHFPRGNNFVDRNDITWTNGPIQKSCLGAGETGWGGLGFPSGITIPSGYIQDTMPDGAIYFELASAPSCNFSVSPTASNATPTVNSSITLSANCSGGDCGSVGYTWSGNGISGSNSTVSFNAPASAGSYTYTVTAAKSGCANQSDTVNITVLPSGGGFCSNYSFTNGQLLGTALGSPVYVRVINSCWYITTSNPSNNPMALDWVYILIEHNGWASGVTPFTRAVIDSCFKQPSESCSGSPAVLAPYAEDAAITLKALRVFPNPSSGTFETSFYLERGQKANIVLTDLQGRTLLNKAIIGNGVHVERINVGNKAAGTLFLRLIKNNGTEVKKISVIR